MDGTTTHIDTQWLDNVNLDALGGGDQIDFSALTDGMNLDLIALDEAFAVEYDQQEQDQDQSHMFQVCQEFNPDGSTFSTDGEPINIDDILNALNAPNNGFESMESYEQLPPHRSSSKNSHRSNKNYNSPLEANLQNLRLKCPNDINPDDRAAAMINNFGTRNKRRTLACPKILSGAPYTPVTIQLMVDLKSGRQLSEVKTYHAHMASMTDTHITILPVDRGGDYVWYSGAVHYTIGLDAVVFLKHYLPRYYPTADSNGMHIYAVPPVPTTDYEVRLSTLLETLDPADVDPRFQERVFMKIDLNHSLEIGQTTKQGATLTEPVTLRRKMWKRPKGIPEALAHQLPANLDKMMENLAGLDVLCNNISNNFDKRTGQFQEIDGLIEEGLYQYILGPNNCEAKYITADMVKEDGHTLQLRVVARALPFVWRYFEKTGYMLRSPLMTRQAIGVFLDTPAQMKNAAEKIVKKARDEGIPAQKVIMSYSPPLRTYIDLPPDYISRNRHMLFDHPPTLTAEQWDQLFTAFYWTYLAPHGFKKNYQHIIDFYARLGVMIRLKMPYMATGESVLRTSISGESRTFKNTSHSHSWLIDTNNIVFKNDGRMVAKNKAKPRKVEPPKPPAISAPLALPVGCFDDSELDDSVDRQSATAPITSSVTKDGLIVRTSQPTDYGGRVKVTRPLANISMPASKQARAMSRNMKLTDMRILACVDSCEEMKPPLVFSIATSKNKLTRPTTCSRPGRPPKRKTPEVALSLASAGKKTKPSKEPPAKKRGTIKLLGIIKVDP